MLVTAWKGFFHSSFSVVCHEKDIFRYKVTWIICSVWSLEWFFSLLKKTEKQRLRATAQTDWFPNSPGTPVSHFPPDLLLFFFFLAFVSLRWYNLNSPLKLKQFQLKQTFYHFHSQHLEQICFTFTMDFVGWTAVTSFTLKTGICGQLRCLTRLKLITFVLYILMMTLLSLHFIFSVFVEIRMRF